MKLKSFGCSFIWGSELKDDTSSNWRNQASTLTWPALLASHLNLPYKCLAWPGRGNLYIAEQILNECADPEPAIFVINWTFIDRFDYVNPLNDKHWDTCRPGEQSIKNTEYFRDFHSEYRDKLTTLSLVKLCIDTLTQCGHRFIMTYMDELMFDQRWHTSPAIELLQTSIKPYCVQFDNKNFVEYAETLGHSKTSRGHILEDGHWACFEYAVTNFKRLL